MINLETRPRLIWHNFPVWTSWIEWPILVLADCQTRSPSKPSCTWLSSLRWRWSWSRREAIVLTRNVTTSSLFPQHNYYCDWKRKTLINIPVIYVIYSLTSCFSFGRITFFIHFTAGFIISLEISTNQRMAWWPYVMVVTKNVKKHVVY